MKVSFIWSLAISLLVLSAIYGMAHAVQCIPVMMTLKLSPAERAVFSILVASHRPMHAIKLFRRLPAKRTIVGKGPRQTGGKAYTFHTVPVTLNALRKMGLARSDGHGNWTATIHP